MKKINSLKIWIIAEIAAIVLIAIVIVIRTAFAVNVDKEAHYNLPAETDAGISADDIERPEDLTADEYEDGTEAPGNGTEAEEAGDIYSLDGFPEEVISKLGDMSTEQKLSMLLVTTPEALCGMEKVTAAGDIFRGAYENNPVSGLIFSDSNFPSVNDGMEMLGTIRKWSRDLTDMNILLGYSDQGDMEPEEMSDAGFSLYCIDADADNAEELAEKAREHSMVPAHILPVTEALQADTEGIAVIAVTEDMDEITDAINDGRKLLYSTGNAGVREGLMEACDSGAISEEALDHAAAYTMTLRLALTAMRPEDMEKEAESEAAQPAATATANAGRNTTTNNRNNTTTAQKTEEELAAEAAQAQAEEIAKQIEAAQQEAARQAETEQSQAPAQNSETAQPAEGQQ